MRKTMQAWLGAAALALVSAIGTGEAGARDLKMSLWFGDSHFMTGTVFKPFIEEVEAATDGDLTITLYSSSVLGKITDQLALVENGIADMAMIVPSYTPGRFPLTESGGLPFAFDSATHGGRVYRELQPYVEEEFESVKFLFMTINTAAALLSSKRPFTSVDSLKGARISGSAGAQHKFLGSLGVIADFMPISEKYVALERGTIEGLLMPLASATGYKMEEVTKYVSRINYSSTPLVAIMNIDAWESLTPEQQQAITEASARAQERLGPAYDAADEAGLKALLDADGELADWSPEELAKLKERAAPFWKDYETDLATRSDKADEFMAALRQAIEKARE